MSVSTLGNTIGHVVRAGAKKEVVRADAAAVITMVKDAQTLCNAPEVKNPRNAVGQMRTLIH